MNAKQRYLSGCLYVLKLSPIAILAYLGFGEYKKRKILNHPTYEYIQMVLKLDSRLSNFNGKNYKIGPTSYIEDDSKKCTYRLKIDGVRGKCKVLVKIDKESHGFMNSIMRDQLTYSKNNKNQQARDPYTPINFKDILIPTKETWKRIHEKINDKEFIEFNKDNYLNGKYLDRKYDSLKDTQLKKDDTFFRITSIIVQSENSYIFHVRPIGPKFRTFNIEDTYYTNSTLVDVVRNVHDWQYKYDELVSSEISPEELKDDLILHKQTNFEQRMTKRKYIMFGNMVLLMAGVFVMRVHMNNNIDLTVFNAVNNYVINNSKVKSICGVNKLVAISYKFNPWKFDYTINGYIMGTQKFARFTGKFEMNDRKVKNPKLESIDGDNKYHLI